MALAKLTDEDPTLKVKYDDETAQTIISGMGELHLEIILDRLMREFNTKVNVGKPKVVYRETISRPIEIGRLFERELGDKKHFGHVVLKLEPNTRGAGLEIINRIDGTVIPEEYHVGMSGCAAGYPVTDIIISITGGSFREGQSTELGYRIAASTAFSDGCAEAGALLLEPIMMVDIITPSEFMGDGIGNINARKGEVQQINHKGTISEIRATVPLKQMFGYSTDLRSATQGRATFSMQFLQYDKS